MEDFGLSARAHDKILRIARTIADLEERTDISPMHLFEAISPSSWICSSVSLARGMRGDSGMEKGKGITLRILPRLPNRATGFARTRRIVFGYCICADIG